MMSRASRMLKWPIAATVLLVAAPIAYAEPVPSSTRPHASADSTRRGGGILDPADIQGIAGLTDDAAAFGAAGIVTPLR